MLVSDTPLPRTPRRLRAAALVLALVALPFGISYAEDPDESEAIRERIQEAVERGDLTQEEANAKYEALKKRAAKPRGPDTDWDAITRRIEGAVERGDMTREEADAKYAKLKQRQRANRGKGGVDWDAIKRRVEGAVERGDMTREQADAKYAALKKHQARGDNEMDRHYKRIGVGADSVTGMRKRLTEKGLSADQTEKALGAIIRIAHEMKAEGDAFELDARLGTYLTDKVGLSADQMKSVTGLAQRVSHSLGQKVDGAKPAPTREEMGKVKERIWAGVKAGKITEEQARERWEGYMRSVKRSGDGARRAPARKALTWEDYRRAELELKKLVDAGRVTRSDADKRLAEMREHIAEKTDGDDRR